MPIPIPAPTKSPVDRTRRFLPSGLAGLAGLACAACCAIPVAIGAGVLTGAGWVATGEWMPTIAVALIVMAAGAWWWSTRHQGGCGGGNCGCGT